MRACNACVMCLPYTIILFDPGCDGFQKKVSMGGGWGELYPNLCWMFECFF